MENAAQYDGGKQQVIMHSMNKIVYFKSLCSTESFEGLDDVHIRRKQFIKENVNRGNQLAGETHN